MKYLIFLFCLWNASFAVAMDDTELKTVSYVDITQYLGRWYQISGNKMPFEPKVCMCAQQTLTANAAGTVDIFNSCNANDTNGPLSTAKGEAVNVDPASNAKFEVDFGFPQKGNYWIIGLARDYSWAVVSDPSRRSLYILSKTPELSTAHYQNALDSVKAQIDISLLVTTNHTGCSYP